MLNENPSPGNVAGGLLNITIKSLGAIAKAGTTRVEGVVGYGAVPSGKGLWLMQGLATIRSRPRASSPRVRRSWSSPPAAARRLGMRSHPS